MRQVMVFSGDVQSFMKWLDLARKFSYSTLKLSDLYRDITANRMSSISYADAIAEDEVYLWR